jgi:hypothetical protein
MLGLDGNVEEEYYARLGFIRESWKLEARQNHLAERTSEFLGGNAKAAQSVIML